MRALQRSLARSGAVLFTLESCFILGILLGASYLTFLFRSDQDRLWFFDPYPYLGKGIVIMLVCQVCMYMNELYDPKVTLGRREFGIRLIQSVGIACMLLSVIYFFWKDIRVSQIAFLIALPTILVFIFLWRVIHAKVLRSGALGERLVLLGNAAPIQRILEGIAADKDAGFEVTTLFTEDDPGEAFPHNPLSIKNHLPMQAFPKEVSRLDADRIVVGIEDRRGTMPFRSLLNCRFRGIQVEEAASFYETLTGKILLDRLRPSWFIFSEGFRISSFTRRVKRVVDVTMAILLLLVSSPVMLLAALLIKLDSRGPVIYKQERVGQGWKDYTLLKFRSMVEDAEAQGVQWAEKDDPRVTRVGRVIRRYRIDELPQLFNVLRGDMSFVGPRPERRFFVEDLAEEIPYYPYRLFVKPGITGWAQIKFHYGASKNETMEKLQYDLYYIKHMSFLLDLSILFDTVRVVMTGKGAR